MPSSRSGAAAGGGEAAALITGELDRDRLRSGSRDRPPPDACAPALSERRGSIVPFTFTAEEEEEEEAAELSIGTHMPSVADACIGSCAEASSRVELWMSASGSARARRESVGQHRRVCCSQRRRRRR